LSEFSVDFYYNDFNFKNTRLDKGQQEITYKTPITDDYRGFFAIDRGNNNLEIYSTHYVSEINVEFYYTILIYNEKIEIYTTYDIDEDYKKLSEDQNRTNSWSRIEIDEINISIEIQNMTGVPVTIESNGYSFGKDEQTEILGSGVKKEYYTIHLENNSKCIYTVNDKIFSLQYNIYFSIIYPEIYDKEKLVARYRPNEKINVNNNKHKNILIILNGYDNGYEIIYK
jgi:hypothetical protein